MTSKGYYLAGLPDSRLSFRNRIINGSMIVHQRTGTIAATGNYTLDRWFGSNGIGGTATHSQVAVANTQAPYAEEAFLALRHTQSVQSTTLFTPVQQRIEDVTTLAGKTVTFSFWAQVSSGTLSITPMMQQYFGTGGSTAVVYTGTPVTLTTTWQKITQTFTLDSISGKTVGTGSFLIAYINVAANAGTFTLDLTNVQVEEGIEATPFEQRPKQIEIALCQRYYEKSYDLTIAPGTSAGSGAIVHGARPNGSAYINVVFVVQKRTTPSVIIYDPNGTGQAGYVRDMGTNNPAAGTIGAIGQKGFLAGSGNVPVGVGQAFQWTADAEL